MGKLLILWAVIVIAGFTGWVLNILKLVQCSFDTIGPEIILRIIGIFMAPLGIVLGFIGHW